MATIYALEIANFAYVGCTSGPLAKRYREHRSLLKSGKHTCYKLQWLYDACGPDHMQMWMLAVCDDDLESRRKAEMYWMLKKADHLLNNEMISFRPSEEARRKGVEASRHVEGNKRSPEANLKRSLAQKGVPKGHGAKISATKRAKREQVMR